MNSWGWVFALGKTLKPQQLLSCLSTKYRFALPLTIPCQTFNVKYEILHIYKWLIN